MARRKYKSVPDVETVEISSTSDVLADENEEAGRNSVAGNDESERAGGEATSEHIEKASSSSVSNSTSRRNPLRTCRVANPVDYQAQDITFHQQRPTPSINTLGEILQTYEQLPHAQFPRTFAQFTLPEAIDRANRSELNEVEWKYESPPPSEDFSELEGSISIPSSPDSCQLFGLRVRTRSPSTSSNSATQSS